MAPSYDLYKVIIKSQIIDLDESKLARAVTRSDLDLKPTTKSYLIEVDANVGMVGAIAKASRNFERETMHFSRDISKDGHSEPGNIHLAITWISDVIKAELVTAKLIKHDEGEV